MNASLTALRTTRSPLPSSAMLLFSDAERASLRESTLSFAAQTRAKRATALALFPPGTSIGATDADGVALHVGDLVTGVGDDATDVGLLVYDIAAARFWAPMVRRTSTTYALPGPHVRRVMDWQAACTTYAGPDEPAAATVHRRAPRATGALNAL